jgi:BirA family biotin operon repressor/biotin-[acetyl-CoA-carboxylase] ligase
MKTIDPVPIEQWPDILNESLLRYHGPLKRAIVLHETDSTQDAARRLDAQIGDVVVASRQTNGRGRLGRAWLDTDIEGVALTLVVARDRPERLAIASAIGLCDGLQACAGKHAVLGIKWPNDILANGQKLAGVLVEQSHDRALVGIGANVSQVAWPSELAGRAISLAQIGAMVDRLAVVDSIVFCMQNALELSDDELVRQFAKVDTLVGTIATFAVGGRNVRGKVLRVDPMKGLAVLTETAGEVWLPAATTSVIRD